MIWAACWAGRWRLAAGGSGVIHSATLDTDRSVPDAAAFRMSRSVSIPARNAPCMTTAEPTFASTMRAAAVATGVSGVVVATRVVIRSRSNAPDDVRVLPPSVTPSHLIEIGVAVRGGGPGEFLGEHAPGGARPQREAGPLLPEHLERRLVERGVGTLGGDGIPDFLKAVYQLEELAGEIVHAITFRASVNRSARQDEGPRIWRPAATGRASRCAAELRPGPEPMAAGRCLRLGRVNCEEVGVPVPGPRTSPSRRPPPA